SALSTFVSFSSLYPLLPITIPPPPSFAILFASSSFSLRHDGRIDRIERLLQKLINFDDEEVEKRSDWEGMQVTQLLFMPNIQSGDEKELLSNYSMDIEALKKKLKEKGGRLKITFTSEEFCEFTVLFPLNHM
ncbi:MAG: hypothetical protein P8Y60_16810, partial [Calditrichota bacterium]